MKNCPISDICDEYESGDNKPPNHHVRHTTPCKKFLKGDCECGAYLQWWLGGKKGISCRLDKHKEGK